MPENSLPDHALARRGAPSRQPAVLAGLAVLALLSAVGVLLAPVTADDPVVTWPRAGEQARSTVLPLAPNRPLSLDATVPCATLAALDGRPEGGAALRTMPPPTSTPPGTDQGLVVSVQSGTVQVNISGRALLTEKLPEGGCAYRVLADAGGVRIFRDGVQRAASAGLVPQVNELATDADPDNASAANAGSNATGRVDPAATRGLAVSLHTDARYESTPSVLKVTLLVLLGATLVALLALSLRWWAGRPVPLVRPRPRFPDLVLVGVSAVWVLLGPLNFDDPWYLLMARGAGTSGSIGNAIYMFNATENPFVASQYVLQVWGALGGWGLVWMRLLPLLYGLLTWLLLRVLLVNGFGSQLGTARAVWALLLAYLLWWLPYGMTLRPEPMIVLFAAATLLLAELARQRRSLGLLAAATSVAALAATISPSGLVAAAPLVLALPWLWEWLRAQRTAARVAAVLVLAATATSLVLVGFADATLGDVLESTAVHQYYYLTFSWYEEIVHYQTLLTLRDSSQWARRAPVVLTIALLVIVAVGSGRQPNGDPVRRLMLGSAVCTAVALGLLALTPTKWVNHFGAVAAAPTLLATAALLRPSMPRGVGGIAATAAAALMVGAVSLSFAGPNLWRPYSDRGQPFGNHFLAKADETADLTGLRPHAGPIQLASPLLWVAVAFAAVGWVWWRRRHGRDSTLTADRAVLAAGSAGVVALILAVFVLAPIREYPGWTVAMGTTKTLLGQKCGLADYLYTLRDTPEQPAPTGPPTEHGAFQLAASQPSPVPAPTPGATVWHDALVSGPETGDLVTPWFTLPAQTSATHLLVPLLGHRNGQQLTLEYATAPGPNPPVAGSTALEVDHSVPDNSWQQAVVSLKELGTQRPAQVRLVVRDQVTGPGSWIAVAQPRLAAPHTLNTDVPTYVDQVSATLLPCADQVSVVHGIAGAPQLRVLGDEGFARDFLDLAFDVDRGGTQVQADRAATTVRVPSWLAPEGPPTLPWGRVERVVYDYPVGLVDLHVGHVQRAGWTRLPTLADPDYVPSDIPGHKSPGTPDHSQSVTTDSDESGSTGSTGAGTADSVGR